MRNPSIKYKHDQDLHKRNKKDHTSISPKAHLASHKTGLTLRDTFGKPTKLNNIQGMALETSAQEALKIT